MPQWLQNRIAPMQADPVKASRRGYEIVGSDSYDEFLDEKIPENKTCKQSFRIAPLSFCTLSCS